MTTHPAVLSLRIGWVATVAALGMAGWVGFQILRSWDIASGDRSQVLLERRTYLASTALSLGLLVEVVSLLLFIFALDELAVHFRGAMCAVGTLNVGPSGWWLLACKASLTLLAGAWLTLDVLDVRAPDYPLLRAKSALALFMTPLALAEGWLLWGFFGGLDPQIGVACCSQVFAPGVPGVGAALASAPPPQAAAAFAAATVVASLTAAATLRWPRVAWAYSGASLAYAGAASLALVSVVAPYVYEQPHHHCPFCLFQGGHGAVGYPIYTLLFGGLVLGSLVGPLRLALRSPGFAALWPRWSRRLTLAGLACQLGLAAVFATLAAQSNLKLMTP